MNAWLRDTARPATDWLMAIMRKIMPAMLSEESDYEEEDKGECSFHSVKQPEKLFG